MGCEKVKGGFVSTMRASMERRRVSNANVTSLRQRKYLQEPTLQKEQEKLERAKEILERRKSQRDRLNASCMHSFGNPNAKHPDHLGGMRRPNTDGMFGRPQWTASLQSDYESLIKLREKEIAVATLRIENQKQLVLMPCKSMQSEDLDTNHTVNGNCDEPYRLLNEEFEFHQDALEQEFSDNHFDMYHKSNDAYLRNDMEDLDKLEHELFAYANETEKYQTENIGTDLLLIEPTVFREHSFNGQRTGSLPPRPRSSISKFVTPPLKSCLKSIKDNQKPISPLNSETVPKSFNSQASSERMPTETSQAATVVATLKMENATVSLPVSNTQAQRILGSAELTNRFLTPWDDHQDGQDYANVDESFEVPFDLDFCKECPDPQPADDLGIPGLPESLEKQVSAATDPPSGNTFSKPEILRPKLSRQMESSESAAVLSWSGTDTVQFQETERGDLNSPNAPNSVKLVPPRYTSTSESWQEEIETFELSVPDECHTPRSLQRYEDKKWGAEKESFMITSLDSEAATTRLLAEVVAIQSHLEDWKLKPIGFEDIFEEQPYYRHRFEQPGSKNEMTPAEEPSLLCIPPVDDDYETFVNTHNEQGAIDMNTRNYSEIVPMDTDDIRESILDTEFRIAQNASNAHVASSVDDHHEKDVLTKDSCDQVDNFTEMPTFEEMEKLHGAPWGIPWKSEGRQTRREEPSADQGKNEQPANSKPAGSTIPVDFHSEKMMQSRVLDQQQRVKHVTVQTDNGLEKSGENIARGHLRSPGISTQSRVVSQYCDRADSSMSPNLSSDNSLLSTERTSRYLNIGYRDLSEAPQIKHPNCKRSFYSSQGLLQVGYSQARQSPQPAVKQKQAQASGFHDSLSDKENWCMSGPDDQELSILASLERLDWKLAAISARAKNRTNTVTVPSLVSQDQISIQSAPAATGVKGAFPDRTPGKFQLNQLRPSSVNTQEPPLRSFRQRRIVGVSNKFHQGIYN